VLGYVFKSSINSGVVSMVGGLILVPVVSLFTPKPDKNSIDQIFACYEHTFKATVKLKERLEEN
jgi:SSS family solute:Na+ symporter